MSSPSSINPTSWRETPALKHAGTASVVIGLAIAIILTVGIILAATGTLPAMIPFDATIYFGMLGGSLGLGTIGLFLRMAFKEPQKGGQPPAGQPPAPPVQPPAPPVQPPVDQPPAPPAPTQLVEFSNVKMHKQVIQILDDASIAKIKEKKAFGYATDPNWMKKGELCVVLFLDKADSRPAVFPIEEGTFRAEDVFFIMDNKNVKITLDAAALQRIEAERKSMFSGMRSDMWD